MTNRYRDAVKIVILAVSAAAAFGVYLIGYDIGKPSAYETLRRVEQTAEHWRQKDLEDNRCKPGDVKICPGDPSDPDGLGLALQPESIRGYVKLKITVRLSDEKLKEVSGECFPSEGVWLGGTKWAVLYEQRGSMPTQGIRIDPPGVSVYILCSQLRKLKP